MLKMFSSKLQTAFILSSRKVPQLSGIYVESRHQRRFYAKSFMVKPVEMRCFICMLFKNVGACPDDAALMSKILVEADMRGHPSQGVELLPGYMKAIQKKRINLTAKPEILQETPAIAWVSGMNTLGPIVGKYSMELAMKKAKGCGIGAVCSKCSNHFGIASFYCLMAMNNCLIGITMSNGNPVMVPPGGICPILGSNPIACGAQVNPNDRFLCDLATTQSTIGKIKECMHNKSKIPDTWALDKDGLPTKDPKVAYKTKKLQPFGSFKGYGFATMVDVLCGVMADANYGSKLSKKNKNQNIGHFFMAIDPKKFAPQFELRLADFMCILRHLPSACTGQKVLVPGDIEEKYACESGHDGIRYTCSQLKIVNDLAAHYCMPAIAIM